MKLFLAGLLVGSLVILGAVHFVDKWEQQERRELCSILLREKAQSFIDIYPDIREQLELKCWSVYPQCKEASIKL